MRAKLLFVFVSTADPFFVAAWTKPRQRIKKTVEKLLTSQPKTSEWFVLEWQEHYCFFFAFRGHIFHMAGKPSDRVAVMMDSIDMVCDKPPFFN